MRHFAKTWTLCLLAGLLSTSALSGAQAENLRSPTGIKAFFLPYDRFTVIYDVFGIRNQVPIVSASGAYVLLAWNDRAVESDTTNWSGFRVRRTIPGVSPAMLTTGLPNGDVVGQFKSRDRITSLCLSDARACDTNYNVLGVGGGFFFSGFRGNRNSKGAYQQDDGAYLLDIRCDWRPVESGVPGELRSVWGSGPNDVFAVGSGGTILHSTGSGWSPMTSPVAVPLTGVSGVSPTNVFAVGEDATMLRYDGAGWTQIPWAVNPADSTPNDVVFPIALDLRGVWATSPTTAFAVGDSSGFYRYNGGAAWDTLNYSADFRPGTHPMHYALRAVWAESATNAIAVGDSGFVLHYDGVQVDTLHPGTPNTLRAIHGTSGTNVFVVGDNGTILRYNGATWTPMNSNTSRDLRAVWAVSGGRAFAAGGAGEIMAYDGNAGGNWTPMSSASASRLYGLWASGGTNALAVGAAGTTVRYDGTSRIVDNCERCRVFLDTGNMSGFRSRYAVTSIDTTSVQYEEFQESDITEIVEVMPASQPASNLENVLVVPNPYKGSAEWDQPGQRSIHFIHLPDGATVRLFTSNLDLIREMKLDSRANPGGLSGELLWDLRNADGREVESGIYVYQVETREGRTREGHFVIIK